jgi:hypothetical protein
MHAFAAAVLMEESVEANVSFNLLVEKLTTLVHVKDVTEVAADDAQIISYEAAVADAEATAKAANVSKLLVGDASRLSIDGLIPAAEFPLLSIPFKDIAGPSSDFSVPSSTPNNVPDDANAGAASSHNLPKANRTFPPYATFLTTNTLVNSNMASKSLLNSFGSVYNPRSNRSFNVHKLIGHPEVGIERS